MSENTGIEWADHTVNFWWGCTKVSPACANCYAEGVDKHFHPDLRLGKATSSHWGPDAPRLLRVDAARKEAMRYQRRAVAEGRRFRVFTNSMSDFFEDRRDLDAARLEALDVIRQTPDLDWLILTKRPERIRELLRGCLVPSYMADRYDLNEWIEDWVCGNPPANVWIGTTVENQEMADQRIPALLNVPAALRFVSCEPLLGPVDLSCVNPWDDFHTDALETPDPQFSLRWVIAGGESGPNARPMHPDWARGLRDQCSAAGVPFLFKQWGEWGSSAYIMTTGEPTFRVFQDVDHWWAKGPTWMSKGDIILAADGLRCLTSGHLMTAKAPFTVLRRVGKKAAGRLLDGVQHDGYPEAR